MNSKHYWRLPISHHTIFILGTLLLFVTLAGCSKKPIQESSIAFYYEPVHWSFNIPDGWERREDAEINKTRELGKEVIEKASGEEISDEDFSSPIQVLYLKNNEVNFFTSDIKAYQEDPNIPYSQAQNNLFDSLVKAFQDNGVRVETKKGQMVIDGVNFATLDMLLYSKKDPKKLAAKVGAFDARIGQYSLLISYNCIDETARQSIVKEIMKSRFRPIATKGL